MDLAKALQQRQRLDLVMSPQQGLDVVVAPKQRWSKGEHPAQTGV